MSEFNKNNPFLAKLIERTCLTHASIPKKVFHFVLDISGSNLNYQVGDSIGIFPSNDPKLVHALLQRLQATGNEPIYLSEGEPALPLQSALLKRLSITEPTKKFLEFLKDYITNPQESNDLNALLSGAEQELKAFLEGRNFVDLLQQFPSASLNYAQLLPFLRKLQPRLYSIASSPLRHPNQVHLTVRLIHYELNGHEHQGVATGYLAERVPLNSNEIPLFVVNSHFKMPEDPRAPVIMVGPGTGIAPFRAFLQEHSAKKNPGKLWLFFGEHSHATSFLYKEELENYLAQGVLSKLSLAFSRDQDHKIYVQHRMLENAPQLWQWLQDGAYLYVCGDAKNMAKDVEDALLSIAQSQGNLTLEQAKDYLKSLKKEKRYQRDVY